MNILNQRDSRWADKILGWGDKNKTTIGSHGCVITCISMMAGLNPDEVNQRLINVKGYGASSAGVYNLILWEKIKEAIPWLEFEWRGYAYENDKVAEAITKYGSCLVQVDFDGTPNTDDKHWVLFVGDKRLYDPWTGREAATSKYPILTGYAIIKSVQAPPQDNGGKVELDSKTFEQLVTKSSNYDAFVAKGWETPEVVTQLLGDMRKSLDDANTAKSNAERDTETAEKAMADFVEALASPGYLDCAINKDSVLDEAKKYNQNTINLEDLEVKYKRESLEWNKKELSFQAQIKLLENQLEMAKQIKNNELRAYIVGRIKMFLQWVKDLAKT